MNASKYYKSPTEIMFRKMNFFKKINLYMNSGKLSNMDHTN